MNNSSLFSTSAQIINVDPLGEFGDLFAVPYTGAVCIVRFPVIITPTLHTHTNDHTHTLTNGGQHCGRLGTPNFVSPYIITSPTRIISSTRCLHILNSENTIDAQVKITAVGQGNRLFHPHVSGGWCSISRTHQLKRLVSECQKGRLKATIYDGCWDSYR